MQTRRAAAALALVLAGCSLAPAYRTPHTSIPAAWANVPAGVSGTVPHTGAPWWQAFNNAELNHLIATALQGSNNLEAATARLAQARAQLRQAGAALLPTADLSAGADLTLENTRTPALRGEGTSSVRGDIAYELDLFGRNRANRQAARQRAIATEADLAALKLATEADVATAYTRLLTLRERSALAQQNLKLTQDVLHVLTTRYNAGAISRLDVTQQQTAVANVQAQLAGLQAQAVTTANALAVLLGQSPSAFAVSGTAVGALALPAVAPTQPSNLLLNRPDIAAAEARLRAANANIGAARAAWFPSLSLGLGAVQGFDPAAFTAGLTASALAPIFSGGAISAGIDLATAQRQELAAAYRQTVLVAQQEVEDALATLASAQMRRQALGQSRAAATEAFRIAKLRYTAGAADYQTLLATQSSLLAATDAAATAASEQLIATINLVRALGGRWR